MLLWSSNSFWNSLPPHFSDFGTGETASDNKRSFYVPRCETSLSSSLFSFFTQLLLSIFMCTRQCNTMHTFQKRLSPRVFGYSHLWWFITYCLFLRQQAFVPSLSVQIQMATSINTFFCYSRTTLCMSWLVSSIQNSLLTTVQCFELISLQTRGLLWTRSKMDMWKTYWKPTSINSFSKKRLLA